MSSPSNRGLDLLIVDDDPLVHRVIIGNLVEKFPSFVFRTASGGNNAIETIRATKGMIYPCR